MVLVNVSVILAYCLKFEGQFEQIPRNFLSSLVYLAILATVVKIICFASFRLYSSLWKYAGVYELMSVVKATFVANGIVIGYIFAEYYVTGDLLAPRSLFGIAFLLDMLLVGGVRFAYRGLRRILRGDRIRLTNAKRVMIIGAGDAGSIVVKEFRNNPGLKSVPVSIIDDDIAKHGKKLNGVHIDGGRKRIIEVARKKGIDEIIIAIPSVSNRIVNEIYAECSKTRCKVKILPSVSQLIDESVVLQRIREVNIEDLLGRSVVNMNNMELLWFLKDKVVLVTGGGGSIGSELCRQICEYGPGALVILDNYENSLYHILNEIEYKYPALDVVPVVANIRERHRIDEIMEKYKPDVVFHAAAHKHVPLMEGSPAEAVKNNVFGTLNVAECADRHNVRKFVLISTDKAVNPTNIMGATKRIAEMIVQALDTQSSTEYVAVRFGNVLGSNGSVIPLFKKQIEQGGPVTVTHRDVIRYFMTIPEAVQLVLQAGAMANGGEIFVLDMGEPVKIYDLAKNLVKMSGFEPDVDIKIEITGLRPGEKLYEELLLEEEGLMATKNEKIHVAKPVFTDMEMLKREIECLREMSVENPEGIKDYIKRIVPTYKQEQMENLPVS